MIQQSLGTIVYTAAAMSWTAESRFCNDYIGCTRSYPFEAAGSQGIMQLDIVRESSSNCMDATELSSLISLIILY